MEYISDILFMISNGLLIPVILLLLFFLVKSLAIAIGFFGDYSRQQKIRRSVTPVLDSLPDGSDIEGELRKLTEVEDSRFMACVKALMEHRGDEAYCERIVANYEVEVQKILGRSRSLIKFGPMLGLTGTLIPMGPALVGLASGDIGSMAYNMQVAFATTVIGMVIAGIGVATLQVNQRFYARQMNDLEFINRKLNQ